MPMKRVQVLLFEGYTTLDALGPSEVISKLASQYELRFSSFQGGPLKGSAGETILTDSVAEAPAPDVLLLPGGFGARRLVEEAGFVQALRGHAAECPEILCVCTGSALLARTGLLDGRRATTNKMAWDWATSQGPGVRWVRRARWVEDGNVWTSSGVSAGIDMALGYLARHHGEAVAGKVSSGLEHPWNPDPDADPFAPPSD